MLTNYQIKFCPLHEGANVQESLISMGYSKRQIKLSIPNKNYLNKKIFRGETISVPIDLLNRFVSNPKYKGKNPELVFKSDEIIGFSKPNRVHSHPLSYRESDNLISYLRSKGKKFRPFLKINELTYDRGLLFRLDYETSGLILLTSNQALLNSFRGDLEKRKFYLAVVKGEIKDAFSYVHHIRYVGEKKSIGRAEYSSNPNAHLEGQKIFFDKEKNISLVLIKLYEGMRHQIRLQLAKEGHPILGDSLYGGRENDRMFLHSFCYQFKYDSLNYQIFDSNLDFLEVVFNTNRVFEMAKEAVLRFQ